MSLSSIPSPSDIDGMLKSANGTEFGLASGVFTKDINKAMYVSEKLDAGTVFVNTYNKTDVAAPFGGFKQSGFGKDLGEWFVESLWPQSKKVMSCQWNIVAGTDSISHWTNSVETTALPQSHGVLNCLVRWSM